MTTEDVSIVNETAIIATFTCLCRPGFQYKSKAALDAHKKTKMHLSFEKSTDLKNTQASSKKLENQIESLKIKLEQKDRIEAQLLERIQHLETENKWLRKHLRTQRERDQVNALINNRLGI
jgi:septal ring factor EnvC (AmiA/AmiB activator)